MKIFLPAAALLATLLGTACSEKTEDANPSSPSAGTDSFIKATSAGSPAFAAVGDVGVVNGTRIASTDPDDAPARLVLRGTVASSRNNITLTLVKFAGAGTYVLKADPDGTLNTSLASYSENGLNGPFYYSQYMTPQGITVGQVVVTSWDASAKRVQGTFSFSGADRVSGGGSTTPKQVSSGTFYVRGVALY